MSEHDVTRFDAVVRPLQLRADSDEEPLRSMGQQQQRGALLAPELSRTCPRESRPDIPPEPPSAA